MTTIAVDTRRMVMVADSRCSSGDMPFRTQKIFKAKDGTLIGISGSVTDALLWKDWYIRGASKKNKPEFFEAERTFSGITLNHKGCFSWDNACVPMPMLSETWAFGSGGHAAVSVMACGKTVEEAVAMACHLDNWPKEPIVVETYQRVAPKKRAPKPAVKKPAKKAAKAKKPTARPNKR